MKNQLYRRILMRNSKPEIDGVKFIQNFTKMHPDQRGHFIEVFKKSKLEQYGLPEFKQINTSFSKKDVVRGLHYQTGDKAQGKLVQCLSGHIIDVVVDIDPNSRNYKRVEIYNLTPGQGAVYCPPNVAHGFWARQDSSILYACTEEYAPGSEGGINPLDRGLVLPWLNEQTQFIISAKDRALLPVGETPCPH